MNGRSRPASTAHAPVALRAALSAAHRIAPGATAGLAARLFMRTVRRPAPPQEEAWLAPARPRLFRFGNGRAVHGFEAGDGEETVLLVHGWCGRAGQLGAFVEPLMAAGFRVVGFDAPGHGRSDGRSATVTAMAEAVAEVAWQVRPVRGIVAHSLGTAAATVALAAGASARACVWIAPPAQLEPYVDRFLEALGMPASGANDVRRRLERRVGVPFRDIRPSLLAPRMRLPLLAFHDAADPDVPAEQARALVAAWPGARLESIDRGLGHRAILRDPRVVARACAFLAEPLASR